MSDVGRKSVPDKGRLIRELLVTKALEFPFCTGKSFFIGTGTESTRWSVHSETKCQIWCLFLPFWFIHLHFFPRSGELWTQKLKSHLVRTQSLNVLPFKPGVGQYVAIHATLTARDFFLAYFYPSSPFTCIFSKTSPNFFLCWPAE